MTAKTNFAKYKEIRAFIKANGTRFMTMDFVKKDGTPRRINFNPGAAANNVVGDAACEARQRGADTRKRNNPHLLNVWEHNNSDETTRFRSVNMDTVYRVACGRKEITYLDAFA